MHGFDALKTIGPEFYFYSRSDDSLSSSDTPQPFRSLEILRIEHMMSWEEWCCFIEGGNEAAVGFFPCLKELVISNWPRLKQNLPPQLPSLEKLQIHGCQQLVASLPRAPNMNILFLKECEEMSLIDVSSFPILRRIRVTESLLKDDQDLFPMLSRLELINCQNFEFLLSDSSVSSESGSERQQYSTTSLSWLTIEGCPKFVSFSQELRGLSFKFNAPKLIRLELVQLENLKSLPEDMHTLAQLRQLIIKMCPKLVDESFPEEGLLPTKLSFLDIGGYPNLTTINYKTLLHLKSLKSLSIEDCPNLSFECLPEE
ncbi:Disease resistance protein [Quillaja saponaria]|uniref:Disease resistance protein n=1 Tax=Quillaja saponaria TaxID=32244 RepID=A0AAD7PBG9_QUISA|nr:Disease resistance protein [Quillaja saponaria]